MRIKSRENTDRDRRGRHLPQEPTSAREDDVAAATRDEPAPTRHITPAGALSVVAPTLPVGCHGWCIAGAEEDEEIVCRSSKCAACPFCASINDGH